MDVKCDHQINVFDVNTMILADTNTTDRIAFATRTDIGQPWTVTASGVPDVTAPDRPSAIMALTEQALASLSGTGYSTLVPTGLADQP
jgi:hypothetical protein